MKRPLLLLGLVAALLLAAAWLLRFRVADELVGRQLAAAGVPAKYRITRLDPFHQRIEDVRLGDPAAPDLIARRVDLTLGYGLTGPHVRAVRAESVRLRGRYGAEGLRLGSLDRLLPRSAAGGPVLPDLAVTLADARLALVTTAGLVSIALDGSGNPQRRFAGRARLTAPVLRSGDCRIGDVRVDLAVVVREGAPSATGPVDIARVECPQVQLEEGQVHLSGGADPLLRRFVATLSPGGFGGRAGPAAFAGLGGQLRVAGEAGRLDGEGRVAVTALSLPGAAAAVRGAPELAGTPLAPTMARARAALAALLSRGDAEIEGSVRLRDGALAAAVGRAALTGADGARIGLVARNGVAWDGRRLRLDGELSAGGGALPTLVVALRQPAAGAPLAGTVRVATYRAGTASFAVPGVRFAEAGGRFLVDGRVRLDGPVAGGVVSGLDLPLRGWVARDGSARIGEGCQPVAFDELHLSFATFAATRVPLCGRPLLARSASGALRIEAATGPLRLAGRSGSAPVTLGASSLRVTERGFAVRDVVAVLGDGATPTRLAAASVKGGSAGGSFAGAEARIGAVPLRLDQGAGRWQLDGGVLRLAGDLRVGDMAEEARFRPLAAREAALVLKGGVILAPLVLREPASGATVATVDLAHDLARGAGGATLVVDALRFTPRGLQPDAITPITLGVVANVAGIVSGRGRIDWTPAGVTSTGRFATDRLDLAAAFGPVTGLAGSIEFTDLLGLVSAPGQVATVAEINPGVPITDGVVRFHLPGENRIAVDDARWPFAGGTLRLEPALLDMGADRERRLTFRLDALDAAAFVQQLDLPNVSATGTFDGVLPMVFGGTGGRIERGVIAARPPGGSIAYVGPISSASIGTMGKLAFDALKAIRYSALAIDLDGQLDGEMVSRVRFTGVREATPEQSLITRLIRGLPFRFNIAIRAPFRGLIGTARTYADPSLLLRQQVDAIQPPASGGVR